MLQPNEVVNLVLAIFLAPMCLRAAMRAGFPGRRWFYAGFASMLGAYVFTVAEGFAAADLFNFLEHSSLAAAGVLFLVGVVVLRGRADGRTR